MTKEQAIAALRSIDRTKGDEENWHWEADSVLTELLKSLGYGEVVTEWDKIEKWYS